MTQCFAYLRVSGAGQLDGDGFDRQRLAISNHATLHDFEIVRWFEEKAVPGATDFENRPAWMEMIGALNGVTTIAVEKLDRLARDMGVQEYILRDLTRRGVKLVSTQEQDIDSPDPTRILFRQMMGAIAQYDKAMIVLKTRAARERIRGRGERCEGAKPFGEHPEKPEEKRTLQLMRGLRDGGMSTNDIARRLNDHLDLDPTRQEGGKWFASTVARVLRRGA